MKGRRADIPLLVRSIPNAPGEILTAQVTIEANGNQRFVVPVTLAVSGVRSARRNRVEDDELPMALPADADDLPMVLPADEPVVDTLPLVNEEEDEGQPDGSVPRRRKPSRGPTTRRGWDSPR